MPKHSNELYRVGWRREGWGSKRMSYAVHVTRRAAMKHAHQLEHATQKFGVSPIEELTIEYGTVLWGGPIPLPDALKNHTQPPKDDNDS